MLVLRHDFRGANGLVGLVRFIWLGRGRGENERPFFIMEDILIRDFCKGFSYGWTFCSRPLFEGTFCREDF